MPNFSFRHMQQARSLKSDPYRSRRGSQEAKEVRCSLRPTTCTWSPGEFCLMRSLIRAIASFNKFQIRRGQFPAISRQNVFSSRSIGGRGRRRPCSGGRRRGRLCRGADVARGRGRHRSAFFEICRPTLRTGSISRRECTARPSVWRSASSGMSHANVRRLIPGCINVSAIECSLESCRRDQEKTCFSKYLKESRLVEEVYMKRSRSYLKSQ